MKRAAAEPNGKKPTVAQAKEAWDSEIDPTLDKVFVKLHAAGFTGMAFSTLQRWKAKGWPERVKVLPEVTAQAKKVVPEVTGTDPEAAEAVDTDLAPMTISDLSELAIRESLTAQIMLSRRIQRRAGKLVQFAPKDTAKLIEALKGPTANVTVLLPEKPAADPQPVGGKLIEHDANERPMTPLQTHIREFRAQQGMKVVK